MGRYKLYCPGCKIEFEDVFTNQCPTCEATGPLVSANYEETNFRPLDIPGFWKFLPWLPCYNWNIKFEAGTVVYKSTGLANELGLNNLYIAFNGYWPERNAKMVTCTFKELEAPPTFQRAQEKCIDNLVIASAGNTAKAFMFAAQHYDCRLYVVVPYSCKKRFILPFEVPKNVTIIATNNESDYSDSIAFAAKMTSELNIMNEGGARNIARRDGMGTVMLEAVYHLKRLPEHYFQAIGSGTGAIAVSEATQRLIAAGITGNLPKLHLSQNKPFTPIIDAWNKGSDKLIEISETQQREAILQVFAKVLTNRHPPYSIGGGVHEALKSSYGTAYGVTNSEAHSAAKLFESTEEIDLVPAASVMVASLIQAVEMNNMHQDDVVLINITGGGERRLWEDFEQITVEPDIICEDNIEMNELQKSLEVLYE